MGLSYKIYGTIGILITVAIIIVCVYHEMKYSSNNNKNELFFQSKISFCRVKLRIDKIIIEYLKTSFLLKEEIIAKRIIKFNDIEDINYKGCLVRLGYLQFDLKNNKSKNNFKPTPFSHDENTIIWYSPSQNKNAKKIIDYINKYKEGRK